jgi:hypothetical protein
VTNPGPIEGYGSKLSIALALKESVIESQTFKWTVQVGYFKEPIAQLAVDLHGFFHARWLEVPDATGAQRVFPPRAPTEDYSIFLDHISCAIDRLSLLCGSYRSIAPNKAIRPVETFAAAFPSNVLAVQATIVEVGSEPQGAIGRTRKRGLSPAGVHSSRYPSRERKKARGSN